MDREILALIPNGWQERPSKPCSICQGNHQAMVFVNPKNENDSVYYCHKKGVTYIPTN